MLRQSWKLVVLGLILAAGLAGLVSCGHKKSKGDAGLEIIKPKVKVETVTPGDMQEMLSFTGILSAWQEANLAPLVPGRVKKIYVREGDKVRTGQLLAEMDETQFESIKSGYEVALSNYNRMKALKEAGAVPAAQYEQAELAYRQAQLGLQSSRENTQIAAPFSGYVTDITKEAGENYTGVPSGPGGGGLIRVSDLRRMKMEVRVSEKSVVKLKKGQKVELAVDVLPDKRFSGAIYRINPAADQASGTFKVIVEIDNKDRDLMPGFYGKVIVHISEKKNVLGVSQSAVINGRYLFVVNAENKAERRQVETGIRNEERSEILSGVQAGDRVVVTGNRGLSEGVEVEIEE